MFDTIISGGLAVLPSGPEPADIGVAGEHIVAIGAPGSLAAIPGSSPGTDKIEIRPMMYVALTYDHRIIDGREAVTFLVRIKECVEDPSRLLFDI